MLDIDRLSVEVSGNRLLDLSHIKLESGDKLAIIGENGSGKTTFINCLLDECAYQGKVSKSFAKNDCGVMFQDNSYPDLMRVKDLLDLVLDKQDRSDFIDDYDFNGRSQQLIKQLSVGERKRLTFGILMYQPKKLYLFDELTAGLDATRRQELLTMVRRQLRDQTVMMITHYFDEIETWATKLLVLNEGRQLFFGTVGAYLAQCPYQGSYRVASQSIEKGGFVHLADRAITIGEEAYLYYQDERQSALLKQALKEVQVRFLQVDKCIQTTYLWYSKEAVSSTI